MTNLLVDATSRPSPWELPGGKYQISTALASISMWTLRTEWRNVAVPLLAYVADQQRFNGVCYGCWLLHEVFCVRSVHTCVLCVYSFCPAEKLIVIIGHVITWDAVAQWLLSIRYRLGWILWTRWMLLKILLQRESFKNLARPCQRPETQRWEQTEGARGKKWNRRSVERWISGFVGYFWQESLFFFSRTDFAFLWKKKSCPMLRSVSKVRHGVWIECWRFSQCTLIHRLISTLPTAQG